MTIVFVNYFNLKFHTFFVKTSDFMPDLLCQLKKIIIQKKK